MLDSIINKPSRYPQEYVRKLFQYSLGEDIANAVSHCVGAIFALVALICLAWTAGHYGDGVDGIAFIIYGLSMLFMFTMSTLYHSMVNHTARDVFKRLDHAAIYIMIVGSFTPYVFNLVQTPLAYFLYAVLVFIMFAGVVYKALFVTGKKIISTIIYVVMGLSSLILLPQIIQHMPVLGVWFMLASGVLYVSGAVLYAVGKFKYSHMIWHLFVLGGVVTMWISINFFILQYR